MNAIKDWFGSSSIVRATRADPYGAWQAWYALSVFVIQALALGTDVALVALLVHPIELAFRIDDVGYAAITAIPMGVGLTAAYYPAGLLADTFRRREIIVAASTIWVFAALVAAHADSEPQLFLARFLAGLGMGISGPAVFSLLGDAFVRAHRAWALSAYWASASIGVGAGLTICNFLVAVAVHRGTFHLGTFVLAPWQQCFGVVAAIGIAVLGLVLTVPEPARSERAPGARVNLIASLRTFGQHVRRHGFLWALLVLGNAISFTSYASMSAWVPAFGIRRYQISAGSSIALLGIFVATGCLLGSTVAGFLAQRGINRDDPRLLPRALVVISTIFCGFAVVFPLMPSWFLAVACFALVAATYTAVRALIVIGIQETAPSEVRGQLLGLSAFVGYVPSALGATLVASLASGALAKTGGLEPAMSVVGGATSALAALLFTFSATPYERANAELRAPATSSVKGEV